MYPFQFRWWLLICLGRLPTVFGNTQPVPSACCGAALPVCWKLLKVWQSACICWLGPWPETWAM